jgi:hypothetical protein
MVENRFGAQFDQLTDTWHAGNVAVISDKRGETVDEGMLTMMYDPMLFEAMHNPTTPQPAPF